MYLLDKVVSRAESALESAKTLADLHGALAEEKESVYDAEWVDISGLLAARARIAGLEDAVESGGLATLEEVGEAFRGVFESYRRDEWSWVSRAYADRFGKPPGELSGDEFAAAADAWLKVKERYVRSVLADAEKEYDEASRIGFGADGTEGAREADFQAVRGTYDTDRFVRGFERELETARRRAAEFKERLARLS